MQKTICELFAGVGGFRLDSTDLDQAGRPHGSHSGNPVQGHNGHMTAMCSILETVLT